MSKSSDALIHIVLFSPKIPNNTGSIIRLCANTGAQLHLVKPLGFELDDTRLKRAGLDYHEYATLRVHDHWQDARSALESVGVTCIVAMTTKFSRPFYEYRFGLDNQRHKVALVFGSETDGLPEDVRADIGADHWLRLPMLPDSRSLNLANSVGICLYEVWRQLGFVGDVGQSVGYHKPTSR
ncbi:tRNA (cytidine(34)-2'-O)-methyltransferase [Moraxella canis]|uniref:tRNA (cytidine(34)-2'-O)-methyltransferase n=1 Tax=Moraxella canis TaxID=90239 RepID=A0ABZ0WYI2_9GAMM|nr:tRNA (cytidine(34)-2'-O)-methyltransferase [Moraxella canis]WQE04102.1 tRNA (cytidine(34)-2'-O)-methyltransferase [Moraxella canis]